MSGQLYYRGRLNRSIAADDGLQFLSVGRNVSRGADRRAAIVGRESLLPRTDAPSCIVLGAGLAGLSAAHHLSLRGWKVTVLEETGRGGGRVLSHRFKKNHKLVCELGAEWIGNDHPKIRQLCCVFGLELEPHSYGFCFWTGARGVTPRKFPPGAWPFSKKAARRFNRFKTQFNDKKIYSREQKKALDRIDWWTQLKKLGFTNEELLRRDLMDSTDFGETIRVTSAYTAAAEYFEGDDSDEMDFKIRGGNDRLVKALVADIRRLGNQVLLRSKVTAVQQPPIDSNTKSENPVRVRVANRSTPYRADFCICTVPAPCLNEIHWEPSLPDEKRAAADQLQYARIVKTAVLYNRRFWKRWPYAGFSTFTGRVSDFCFDSTYRQPGNGGILCSYAIGDKADDVAGEPDVNSVKQWLTEDMIQVTGGERRENIRALDVVRHPWQSDKRTGGAYALYRPGQWFTVQPALARPYGRVRFAGEHIADWQGFMEGAVETGLDAAESLTER
jgi:monoamine oxidase